MGKLSKIGGLAAGLAVLLVLTLVWGLQMRGPVAAETVVGGQTAVLLDGNTAYTATKYTAGYLTSSFGEIVLQVESDISGTATLTVTPQFAINQTACGSMAAGDWVDAAIVGVFPSTGATSVTASTISTNTITTTVTAGALAVAYTQVPVLVTLAGDGDALLRFPTMGRCFRVKLTAATTYTPALYAWMVNTQ